MKESERERERERGRQKIDTCWRLYDLTNLTVFAVLVKDVPMGFKKSVLPGTLLKNQTVNCVAFEEITRQSYNGHLCFFEDIALDLFRNHTLRKEISKVFNVFITTVETGNSNHFKGVQMNDFPIVQDLLRLKILLQEIDLVYGKIIVAAARRSVQNCKNTLRLKGYNNHIGYGAKSMQSVNLSLSIM